MLNIDLFPFFFQEVFQPYFKKSKVQLIPKIFANLWDFPIISLCQTLLGNKRRNTEAFEHSIHKTKYTFKRNLKGKQDDHFLPYIYCSAALQSISTFVKHCLLLERPTASTTSPFILSIAQLAPTAPPNVISAFFLKPLPGSLTAMCYF